MQHKQKHKGLPKNRHSLDVSIRKQERIEHADERESLVILTEDVISLSEAAREVDVHVGTIHRWRQRGVRGIRLKTLRVGGKILTSRQALTAFLVATQR